MVATPKIRRDDKGKQQEFAEKKKKEIRWVRVHAAKSYFPYSVLVKIMSFMMIQPPSPAFNILFQFNPSF